MVAISHNILELQGSNPDPETRFLDLSFSCYISFYVGKHQESSSNQDTLLPSTFFLKHSAFDAIYYELLIA